MKRKAMAQPIEDLEIIEEWLWFGASCISLALINRSNAKRIADAPRSDSFPEST